MRQVLLFLFGVLFFLGGGAFMALTGASLVVSLMMVGMGVACLLGLPIAWGRARNDPDAGGPESSAKGGYAVLGLLGIGIFTLIGLAMLVSGQPVDEGKGTWRVPNSALEARISGAVIFLLSAGLLVLGARRIRGKR